MKNVDPQLQSMIDRILPAVDDTKLLSQTREDSVAAYSLFMQLRQDFRREEMYGAETILCVDFSEIFPYLHPHGGPGSGRAVRPHDALLARLVFEQSKTKLILPPASLQEFFAHVNYLSQQLTHSGFAASKDLWAFQGSELASEAKRVLVIDTK